MWLTVENVWTRVSNATQEELAWLGELLVMKSKGGFGGRKVITTTLLSAADMKFPSGLLQRVKTEAERSGVSVVVRDQRPPPLSVTPFADLHWLYDHQLDAVETCAVEQTGLVRSPTASGKGEMIAAMVKLFSNYPAVVYVDRATLMLDLVQRIEQRTGEVVGMWGDGKWRSGRVIVAMFPTVHAQMQSSRAAALFSRPGLMIVDEAHILGATSNQRVAIATHGARMRLGFSGTPLSRSDARSIWVIAATGEVIYSIDAATLVAAGIVASPTVHVSSVPVATLRHKGEYEEIYTECMLSDSRMRHVVRTTLAAPSPRLVFVKALEHGEALAKALAAQGESVEFVSGKQNTHERKAAIRRLSHGQIDTIIANVVFQKGEDIPAVKAVVMAAGGKSEIAVLQSLGRGMRRRDKEGRTVKDTVPIYDIADRQCGCKRELPQVKNADGTILGAQVLYAHRACRWFEGHLHERIRSYRKAGYTVVMG